MMINVVAILVYLIIHINMPIFAVGSQIFIRLRLLTPSTDLTQRNPLKCLTLVLPYYLCRLALYGLRQKGWREEQHCSRNTLMSIYHR